MCFDLSTIIVIVLLCLKFLSKTIHVFVSLWETPWYDLRHRLGVKNQLSIYPSGDAPAYYSDFVVVAVSENIRVTRCGVNSWRVVNFCLIVPFVCGLHTCAGSGNKLFETYPSRVATIIVPSVASACEISFGKLGNTLRFYWCESVCVGVDNRLTFPPWSVFGKRAPPYGCCELLLNDTICTPQWGTADWN